MTYVITTKDGQKLAIEADNEDTARRLAGNQLPNAEHDIVSVEQR